MTLKIGDRVRLKGSDVVGDTSPVMTVTSTNDMETVKGNTPGSYSCHPVVRCTWYADHYVGFKSEYFRPEALELAR